MFDFKGENAIDIKEAANTFEKYADPNAQKAITVGTQNDKRAGEVNGHVDVADPLAKTLINNGVANKTTLNIDPAKTGREKWYFQTPFVITDTALGKDDDGTGCCVGLPTLMGCRERFGIHELCVKDCVETVLDEMMEEVVKQKDVDTWTPFGAVGKSLKAKRAAFVAKYAKFAFERNAILGTPTYKGNGLRNFNGLISMLLDERVMKVDGGAGFISSIEMLACRMTAMGLSMNRYIAAINPIAMRTLIQEVRTYLKTNPFTSWTINGNTVSYEGLTIVSSRYVDVDLTKNTTSMWLIDPSVIGIKLLYSTTNPYKKLHQSADDCGGNCVTLHNAGSTVVSNWSGLMMIKNIALSSVCDSVALTGLDDFVNSGSTGHLFPAVKA